MAQVRFRQAIALALADEMSTAEGRFSNERKRDVCALSTDVITPLSNPLVLQPLHQGK